MTEFPSTVHHVSLTVIDVEVSRQWYQRLLNTAPVLDEEVPAHPEHHQGFRKVVFVLPGGFVLALVAHRATDRNHRFDEFDPGLDHIGFACADPSELDQAEVERYQMMAEAARQAEADLWERAGMVAGRGSPTSAAGRARCCRRCPPPSGRTGGSRRSTPTAPPSGSCPRPSTPDLVDLQERYLAFRAARGDDNAAGLATAEDLRRWEEAFEATARRPPTFFAPMFTAVGRRPA